MITIKEIICNCENLHYPFLILSNGEKVKVATYYLNAKYPLMLNKMDLDLMDKEFDALNFRSMRRNLRQLPQVGTSIKDVDASRKSLMPGKRISKTGNVYWETRKNRSDSKGSTV